jgi:tetratricopeptide (TPR) repeat protein
MRPIGHLALLLLACVPVFAADSSKDLLSTGKVDSAIASLSARISSNQNDAEAFNLLCRSYWALGEWDRAVTNCEKAVGLESKSSLYHHWLGRAYGEKADHSSFFTAAGLAKKVRTEFERAVELNPDNLEARLDLAEFYLEAPGMVGGGVDKARAQAAILGKTNPSKEHWVYARIAEKNKDAPVAEKEYRAAIDLSNEKANSWLNLGMFLRKQQRYDEMEAAIRKATTPPVTPPEVLVDAAETLSRAGRDFSLAIELVQRYLSGARVEEAPAFKAEYLLGTLLEKQGDRQGAARAYRESLALAHEFGRSQEALKRVDH